MKRAFLLAALVVGCGFSVLGQDGALTTTSTLEGARFEIIQAAYDQSITFRLDKFTGRVNRLATCSKDDSVGSDKCWKEMIIVDFPKGAIERVRYQIIINNALKHISLMQIDTGRTWHYGLDRVEDKWYPYADCTNQPNNGCVWRPAWIR